METNFFREKKFRPKLAYFCERFRSLETLLETYAYPDNSKVPGWERENQKVWIKNCIFIFIFIFLILVFKCCIKDVCQYLTHIIHLHFSFKLSSLRASKEWIRQRIFFLVWLTYINLAQLRIFKFVYLNILILYNYKHLQLFKKFKFMRVVLKS